MSDNIFVKVEHGVEKGVVGVVHVAEDIFSVGGKVIKVIHDVQALTPEFKAELKKLIDDVKPLAVTLAPVVATQGKNPVADIAAVVPVTNEVIQLVKDFLAFLPTLEAAMKKIGEDVVSQ